MPRGGPVTVVPSSVTEPAVGSSSPPMQRSSVVLPAPDGPTTQAS